MTTLTGLANALGVSPGDVDVLMEQLGATELTDEIATEVRYILEPHLERRMPEFYGATGSDI
jgi:hypothetical protein